jgi:hypothetical protein
LDESYPGRLQPDLIERYYQSSLLWQRFLNLSNGDPLLVQLTTEDKLVEMPSQAISYSPDLSVIRPAEEPEDVEIEINGEAQADAIPNFEEEVMPADECPFQTGGNRRKEYTSKRIRADDTGSMEGSEDESTYTRRHSDRLGGRKRKRTNVVRDGTLEDSKELHIVAAGQCLEQINKKRKQSNDPGDMMLDRLLQMQEELGRMIAAHQKRVV